MSDQSKDNNPIVLIVDDDPAFIDSLSSLLTDSGFTVASAGNVDEAMRASTREQFDLCVVDICLNSGELEPSGLSVAIHLRVSYPQLPIIGYSVNFGTAFFGTVENEPFNASLPKSAMNSRTLLRTIANWRELAIAYRDSRELNNGDAIVREKTNQFRAFVGSKTTPTLAPSAGLFVGIDEYEHHEVLKGASQDARSMLEYFAASRADGWWRNIRTSREGVCFRSEVLVALHELVEQVSEGNTGLFYFAGHGYGGEAGLILLGSDTHRAHVYDTGIPFDRVLSILSNKCRRNARFLVILDCCRSGPSPSSVPSMPNNVTVLYACPQGETTVEFSSGGVLTQAIFLALDSRVERDGDTIETRTLGSVFMSVPSIMAAASNAVRAPVLVGGLSGEIHLPIMKTTRQREVVTGVPPASMLTTFAPTSNIDEFREQVSDAYLDCIGASVKKHWLEYFLEVHVESREGCVWVHLDEGVQNLPCALIQRFPGKFNELQMEWSTQLLPASTRPLAELLGLDWEPLDAGCIMSWKADNLRGQARIESIEVDKSLLRVRCFNREGSRLGIDNLCPLLNELYNRFRWLTLRMENPNNG